MTDDYGYVEVALFQFLAEGLKQKTGQKARMVLPGTVGAMIDSHPEYSDYLQTRTIEQNPLTSQPIVDVVTFCEDPEYLGLKLKPKQKEILWRFFHEMEDQINPDTMEVFQRTKWKEFVGKIGMRSGKTVMASCAEAYSLYRLLMLKNPQEYYGLVPGQEIYLINVAASETQSKDTVFAQLRARIENSKWFQRYISHLKSFGRVRRGDYLYRELDQRLEFHDKAIICMSMNSNSLTNVGKTAKFVVFDELAKFKTTEGHESGDAVYSSISRATTTFGWEGHVWSISSSLSDIDKMEELYEIARKGDVPGMLGYHLATWEFNPSIQRADLEREYIKDESAARRDYECIPPKSTQEYIQDPEAMHALIFRGRKPMFTASQRVVVKPGANGKVQNYVQLMLDQLHMPKEKGRLYVAHGDPGLNDDSYCLGIGHLEYRRRNQAGGDALVYPNVVMDALLEWDPIVGPDSEQSAIVDMLDVAKWIKDIALALNLSYISFDRWNSAHLIQELLALGINAEDLKFTDQGQFAHYLTLKRVVGCGQFESFDGDEKTFEQWKHLRIINGTRIDHPKKGKVTDKDRSDCWAAICHKLMSDLIEEGTGLPSETASSKMCKPAGLIPATNRIGGPRFGGGGLGGPNGYLR